MDRIRDQQVAIISGGGSGHEPAHAGYIGDGMLSAAVAGEVFTSPDTDSILAAIKAVAGNPGVLLVVKNYTRDRLNFGLAAEMARSERIPVEMIIVDDDVELNGSAPATGARGLAGTIFIHKLGGRRGAGQPSRGCGYRQSGGEIPGDHGRFFFRRHFPTVGKPSFELGVDEMELGLRIHREPGVTCAHLQSTDGNIVY